jgi:ADYC domain
MRKLGVDPQRSSMKKMLLARLIGLAAPCAALAACVDMAAEASDPAPDLATIVSLEIGDDGLGVYDIEPQGRWLVGSELDVPPFTPAGSTAHFYVDRATKDGKPIPLGVIAGATLASGAHVGTDPWFNGVVVSNGTIQLQLQLHQNPLARPAPGAITLVRLLRRSTGTAFDTNVCGPEGTALPLAGWFRTDGLHMAEPGRITFACNNAAAHKCTVWGYPAGPAPGLPWDANQACTRMTRADYGANGESHTRMETAIMIADSIPGANGLPTSTMLGDVQRWPPDPERFFFEAAWFAGTRRPWCLSKVRWNSIPVGGYPGMGMSDPRMDPLAKHCEDITVEDIVASGALTFVASQYSDLALMTWRAETAGGPDFVTTVRGYHAVVETQIVRPFSDYHSYSYVNTVGFLLRKPPGSIIDPATELVAVHMFREIGVDRMVLAAANDGRFAGTHIREPVREGYVLAWERSGTIPFRLYRHAGTGDYLSTTDNRIPDGYGWVANIGWVMAPEPGL